MMRMMRTPDMMKARNTMRTCDMMQTDNMKVTNDALRSNASKVVSIACVIIAAICFILASTALHGVPSPVPTIGTAAILPPLMIHVSKKKNPREMIEFVPFWMVSGK